MEQLSATDLHRVLDVARELAAARDVEALHASVLPQLRRLVAYDSASFNEIAPDTGEAVVAVVDPADSIFEGGEEIFGAYAHQNPLIAAACCPGDSDVLKFSDFISRRRLHSLDIYDLVYAAIEVEHQIAFTLPAPSALVIGFALNRRRTDFSERDRQLLRAVRPFVVQAYGHAAARVHARATVAALEHAAGSAAYGVIVLRRDGRIEFATELAARWLTEQSGSAGRLRLPEPLYAWSDAERRAAHDPGAGCVRLELDLADGPLTAQFVPRRLDDFDTIILRPRAALRADVLRDRGLTDREIQVVMLLAGGLSNAQMALELGLSERTIAKHLEHIYNKLDVANRTAAVARARGIDAPSATGGSHTQDGLDQGQRP